MRRALFVATLLAPMVALAQGMAGGEGPGGGRAAGGAGNAGAMAAYLDGLDALREGKYGEASGDFSKAIEGDEENARYYLARGVARTLNQQFAEAMSDLRRSQRLAGNGMEWESRGWLAAASGMGGTPDMSYSPGIAPREEMPYALALSDLQGNYLSSRNSGGYWDREKNQRVETPGGPYTGDFQKVARMFIDKHLPLGGEAGKLVLERVRGRVKAGDDVGALDRLRPILAAHPDDGEALMLEGQCLAALGDHSTARRIFTRLLVEQPQSARLLAGRAIEAAQEGDAYRAMRDLQALRAVDPAAAGAAQGRVAEALASTRAAGTPQDLWNALEKQAKGGASAEKLQQAAQELAWALAPMRQRFDERYQERLASLEGALRERPDDVDRIVALAEFLQEESSLLYEEVEPRSSPVWYRDQTEETRQRELKRVDDLVAAALGRNAKHVGALTLWASRQFDEGDFAGSQATLLQALAIRPDDPRVLDLLAEVLYVAAARRAAAASDLRTIRQWSQRRFDTYPPTDWLYTRAPSDAELARAEQLDREARQLTEVAQDRIGKAARAAAGTAMGAYLKANLERLQGNLQGAHDDLQQAVKLDPRFEKAWFGLAGVATQLNLADEATMARTKALNLSQTTAAPWLVAAWYRIPRTQFKSAREGLQQAVACDPADARIAAYLGVIDAATEKPGDAVAHFAMAAALADVRLASHGWTVSGAGKGAPLVPLELGLPIAVHVRLGASELMQAGGDGGEASFRRALALVNTFGAEQMKTELTSALLPNPELAEGTIPMPETPGSLRIRAEAGVEYARWAQAAQTRELKELAGSTYQRLVVNYTLTSDNMDALQGLAKLGLAELYLKSGEADKAAAAMARAGGVPSAFTQEMLRVRQQIEDQSGNAAGNGNQQDGGNGRPDGEATMKAQMRAIYQRQLQALDGELKSPRLSAQQRRVLQEQRDSLALELQHLGN